MKHAPFNLYNLIVDDEHRPTSRETLSLMSQGGRNKTHKNMFLVKKNSLVKELGIKKAFCDDTWSLDSSDSSDSDPNSS